MDIGLRKVMIASKQKSTVSITYNFKSCITDDYNSVCRVYGRILEPPQLLPAYPTSPP